MPQRFRQLLSQVPGSAHDELLTNLIGVDLDYRLREPGGVAADEYAARFGEYQAIAKAAVHAHYHRHANADTPSIDKDLEQTKPASKASHPLVELPCDIGSYQLLERIGGGGFGTVYRALDKSAKREVAIKIPNDGEFDETLFISEARAAGNVHHPNICPLFYVGSDANRPFLVYRLVPGVPLAHLLTSQKLAVDQVIDIVLQLCDALGKAHEAGILHRDIKPANVIMETLPGSDPDGLWTREGAVGRSIDGVDRRKSRRNAAVHATGTIRRC